MECPDCFLLPGLTCGILDIFGQLGSINPAVCMEIQESDFIQNVCCNPFLPGAGQCCGPCSDSGDDCEDGLTCDNDFCVPGSSDEICNANYDGGNGVGKPFVPPGNDPDGNPPDGFVFCAQPNKGKEGRCGTVNPYKDRPDTGHISLYCCDENLEDIALGGEDCWENCECGEGVEGPPTPFGATCGQITGQCPVAPAASP